MKLETIIGKSNVYNGDDYWVFKKADEEVKKVDNVNIEDADPALASFNDVNEESHDWLWWILALLAGAVTIEEFNRRQRNKKKAAQTETSGK